MQIWAAEEHVDEDRARRLIENRFPGLGARSVELVSEGWDYVVHRVDGEWAFRFPRREVVVAGTEREIAYLPRLADLLDVEVPAPVFVGVAGDDFPWPFYGARFLPGVEATGRAVHPVELAGALRVLHSPAALSAVGGDLPVDPLHRVDMAVRVPRTRETLRELGELTRAAQALLAEAERLPAPSHTSVCHGDLHARQLLVDRGHLSGIVDWVDLCRSDPAVDLGVAWSALEAGARAAFFAEYGPIDRGRAVRARVVGAFLCAALIQWARAEGVPAVERSAAAGLRRALEDA